jgi:ATP-dependent Clp protease protease subunit
MVLYVSGEIDSNSVKAIIESLVKEPNPSYVLVYIDSVGGCPSSAFAIYEALRAVGCRIIVHAVREVHSAALIIYLAGDERYAAPRSTFCIHEVYHEGAGGTTMTQDDYEKQKDDLAKSTEVIFQHIIQHTKLTKTKIAKELRKAAEHDWVFDAPTAVRIGIAHQIGFPFPKDFEA